MYSIESLQGEHVLDGLLGSYEDGAHIPNTDYVNISASLTDTLGRDFIYLHPKVLTIKCEVKDGMLHLDNKVNKEAFRVIIVPGMKTISLSNLQKIKAFCRAGGSVLFTTRLPEKSVEPEKDKEVKKLVDRMLSGKRRRTSPGNVFFIEKLNVETIREKPATCCKVVDVDFPTGQELNYTHKANGGQSIYYPANLKSHMYEVEVILRGKITPVLLDPHTGKQSDVEYKHQLSYGAGTTSVILSVKRHSSVFTVDRR